MKTTTANFDTEKNKNSNSNDLVHLLEIVTSGGTVYYSDQDITVSGQNYIAKVFDWGDIENQLNTTENIVRTGEVSLELSNFPRIDNVIDAGDIIRIYVWYKNLTSADKIKIFEGAIFDEINWTDQVMSFIAYDRSKSFDKIIWNPLQTDSFPGTPDPDDVGKQMPIIYGDYKNHIPLVIDTGGATTLTADILSTGTANVLVTSTVSPIAFESSGSFYVGQEKFNYAGKTDASFTGITRPGTKVAHSNGDGVFEDHLVKYLVANHITKTSGITNVRLKPADGKLRDAVDITSPVTLNTNDSGVATISITAANVAALRNLINVKVDQQPNVSDEGTHPHVGSIAGPSQSTLFGNGINSQHDVTNPSNAYDQNEDTYANLTPHADQEVSYLGLDFNYSGFNGLTIVEAVACIRHLGAVTPTTWRLDLNSVSWQQNLGSYSGATTQKFIVSALNNETDWSKLNGLRAYFVDGPVGGIAARYVYEIWWEVKYTPTVTVSTHAADGVLVATTPSSEVIVTGNSLSDALGILICDVEGYMDDNPSHYTDSALSLIKEPWDIIHHLMENYGNGITDSDIDLAGSFQDAEDNLPSSYEFAFAINTRRALNRLLPSLAEQCFCRIVYEAGLYKLLRIKLSGTSIKSIDTDDDTVFKNNKLQVGIRKRGLDEIKNDLEIKYKLNPTLGGWSDENAYEGTSIDTDSTSITAYGNRQKTFLMFAIQNNSAMADDIAGKLLSLLKDPREEISITSFLKHIELERGDVIDITTSQLGISAADVEIINTRYSPFGGGKYPEVRITGLIL